MARQPTRRNPKSTRSSPSHARDANVNVVERLSGAEAKTVLGLLLDRRPQMRSEAERIATKLISSPSLENVAASVYDAMSAVDLDALNGRAGKHDWGYVEPGEAAVQLLHESIEPLIDEMRRTAELGMLPAAASICAGIVEGLYQAREARSETALEWAPDFPAEEASYVIGELLRGKPRSIKRDTADQLRKILVSRTPEWADLLERTLAEGVRT